MNTYTCKRCRRKFEGEPALKNNAGVFCANCKAIIHAHAAQAQRERNSIRKGYCVWCGHKITDELQKRGIKKHENICKDCRNHRDWMLGSIRFSDHLARYVARTEAREAPLREDRKKQPPVAKAADDIPNELEARMRQLEGMVNKIISAFDIQ